MNYFNFHTHTIYCDGKAEPEAYIIDALNNKMTALGFSCHSPLPFENSYSIKEENIEKYVSEIRSLQEKYKKQIQIFLGFEFDYVPGISENPEPLKQRMDADFVIGSVHMVRNKENGKIWFIDGPESNYVNGLKSVFDSNIKVAVTTYFEQAAMMISSQKPDIIGHVDKVKMHNRNRFFSEDEKWYNDLANLVLDVAKKNDSIIEVNTRGIYKKRSDSLFPGINILKEIYRKKIPVTISTDAHLPEELILFYPETIEILKNIGFKSIKCLSGKMWKDVPL